MYLSGGLENTVTLVSSFSYNKHTKLVYIEFTGVREQNYTAHDHFRGNAPSRLNKNQPERLDLLQVYSTLPFTRYLLLTQFEVRAVSYGSSFYSKSLVHRKYMSVETNHPFQGD